MLEQRLADALSHAAVHLALGQHRIYQSAEVVDRRVAVESDVSRLGVDLDLGDVAAVREGGWRRLGDQRGIEALRQVIRQPSGGTDFGREVEQRDRAIGAGDAERAGLEL
jgi:hypothetical protein